MKCMLFLRWIFFVASLTSFPLHVERTVSNNSCAFYYSCVLVVILDSDLLGHLSSLSFHWIPLQDLSVWPALDAEICKRSAATTGPYLVPLSECATRDPEFPEYEILNDA